MTPVDAPPTLVLSNTYELRVPERANQSASTPWAKRPIRIQVESPAAPWLREAIAEIQELTSLRADWDTYAASPIQATSATEAVLFLVDNAHADIAMPAVVPLRNGGVQLEWHRGGLDLEVSFSNEGSLVYFEDGAETVEAPSSEASDLIRAHRQRLSA